MLKPVIVGNGAIGNLLVTRCHLQQIPCALITRSGQALNFKVTQLNEKQLAIEPHITDWAQLAEFDLLIVPLKAYQVLPALRQAKPYLPPHMPVVLLHNGMGTHEDAVALLPDNPLVAATTSHAAYKPSLDSLCITGTGQTHAGWISAGNSPLADEIHDLLETLLPPCQWHHDIRLPLWHKLAINAVINPLTALNNVPNGALSHTRFDAIKNQLCNEIAAVMRGLNMQVSVGELVLATNQVIANTADNFSSMHQDLAHNRQSEIDFINGFVVLQAQKLGLQASANQHLWQQITDRQL